MKHMPFECHLGHMWLLSSHLTRSWIHLPHKTFFQSLPGSILKSGFWILVIVLHILFLVGVSIGDILVSLFAAGGFLQWEEFFIFGRFERSRKIDHESVVEDIAN